MAAGRSTGSVIVKTVAQGFAAPSARRASRLHVFATNLHE
jgi:hypothetical protein